jgi:alpha-L-fucosidase
MIFHKNKYLTKMKSTLILIAFILCLNACSQVKPPEPFGPVPSERQLAWHEMEYYMFVHFTVNTFTDKEWGYGDEKESVFNPSELDCMQWAKVAKDAGMKGIIIKIY